MDNKPVDWEKLRRGKEAQERAERDLLEREKKKDKTNLGFFGAKEFGEKPHGFTWDSETLRKNLERMSNIGFAFMICTVAMGFIQSAVGIFNLGQGYSQIFDIVMTISKTVGLLCSGVAFISSLLLIWLKKYDAWGSLVTSSIAFILYIFYCVVLYISWLI